MIRPIHSLRHMLLNDSYGVPSQPPVGLLAYPALPGLEGNTWFQSFDDATEVLFVEKEAFDRLWAA